VGFSRGEVEALLECIAAGAAARIKMGADYGFVPTVDLLDGAPQALVALVVGQNSHIPDRG
jgi:hypothetical protein